MTSEVPLRYAGPTSHLGEHLSLGGRRETAARQISRWTALTWRLARITVATALLLFSISSVLLPTAIPMSHRAVITSRVAIVRAPVAGEARSLISDIGDRVEEGELLFRIQGEPFEHLRFAADLETQRNQLRTRLQSRQSELQLTRRSLQKWDEELTQHSLRQARELELRLDEELHRLALARQEAGSQEARHARFQPLYERNLLAEAAWAEVTTDRSRAIEEVEILEARVDRLREQLNNAGDGLFVGREAEQPSSFQMREAARSRAATLEIEVESIRHDLADLERQMAEASRRRERVEDVSVVSPASGPVWRRVASDGQFVTAGDELFQIADADTAVLQVFLHRRHLGRIAIGSRAWIHLPAEGRQIEGEVAYVKLIDPRQRFDLWAVDLKPPDQDHFEVLVRLPEAERRPEAIGQVARVLFLGAETSRLYKAVAWIGLRS